MNCSLHAKPLQLAELKGLSALLYSRAVDQPRRPRMNQRISTPMGSRAGGFDFLGFNFPPEMPRGDLNTLLADFVSLFRGLLTRVCAKRKRQFYVEVLARIQDQLFSLLSQQSRIPVSGGLFLPCSLTLTRWIQGSYQTSWLINPRPGSGSPVRVASQPSAIPIVAALGSGLSRKLSSEALHGAHHPLGSFLNLGNHRSSLIGEV